MKDAKQVKREKDFRDLLEQAKKHMKESFPDNFLDEVAVLEEEQRQAIPFPYGVRVSGIDRRSY